MERLKVKATVADVLREKGEVSSGDLARRLGISRQSAHLALATLVKAGALQRVGAGRGSRYRRMATVWAAGTWPRLGLAEDVVWQQFESAVAAHARETVVSILHYAVTEMVNNAIEHSGGVNVSARVTEDGKTIAFDVEDDGVGIFEHVMRTRGLRTPFEAIAELQKGKVTTAPNAHSGEGIFFTSKMADRMIIGSGTTSWVIDGIRNDQGAETAPKRVGTLVHFEIARDSKRTAEEVFAAFTDDDLAFNRTRPSIRLFREGAEIVSRSEAKRLLTGLERFTEVELDFKDVRGIGQGFSDEVFRVWQQEHPQVKLIVTNANPAVQFMIARAQATAAIPSSPAASALGGGVSTVNVAVGSSTKTST